MSCRPVPFSVTSCTDRNSLARSIVPVRVFRGPSLASCSSAVEADARAKQEREEAADDAARKPSAQRCDTRRESRWSTPPK
jgi:hypothetical protein